MSPVVCAIIGTGYVADFYPVTLASHTGLRLAGAYDHNPQKLGAFIRRWRIRKYSSLDELLADNTVEIVLNFTNPRSHFEVTRRSLEAGKHVYSEKPIAMSTVEALQLVALAERKKLLLSSAPCSVLGESAQTLWKAVRERVVGRVRLIYATFDDGMIAPQQKPWTWLSASGAPWPAKDEFEVGCTYEHAGYVLTWLVAMFGPVKYVTSFASCQIPDKGIPVDVMAPDFSVACLEFAGKVVARVTCGLVAPKDKSLTIVGDDGVLFVGNVRNDACPVVVRHAQFTRWQSAIAHRTQWIHRWLEARLNWPGCGVLFQKHYPLVRKPVGRVISVSKPVDFLLGPAEMSEAIREKRVCRLSAELGAHIVEIIEIIQHPEHFGGRKEMSTTFPEIQPMPWAN